MKRLSILALLFIGLQPLVAQDILTLLEFPVGSKTKVFGTKVNVRAAASTNSATLTQLNLGDAVTILAVDTAIATYNGWNTRWHKISFKKENKTQEGYVLGALLSLFVTELGGVTLLANVVGNQPGKEDIDLQVFEVRALKNNVVVATDTVVFMANELDWVSIETSDTMGVAEWPYLASIHLGYPACGYGQNYIYMLWNGAELIHLPLLHAMGDGGIFSESENYIFPSEEEGVPDKIMYNYVMSQGSTYDGNLDLTQKVRFMKWNGKMFEIEEPQKMEPED